jgi:Sugar (and other) transporter
VYGISYLFTEFGPNVTTFVLPSEIFPVTMRATGHGISAGVGKVGAFAGVFAFPLLQASLGLRGTLLFTAGISVLGLLTLTLPEPARRSLDEVSSGEQLPEVVSAGQLPEVAAVSQPPVGDSPSSWLVLLGSSSARRPVPPDRAA